MAVPTSGAVAFSTVNSVFGYGIAMSSYAGRSYWANGAPPVGYTFPGSNFPMSMFYGTSGHDEWNCACACDCNCACSK